LQAGGRRFNPVRLHQRLEGGWGVRRWGDAPAVRLACIHDRIGEDEFGHCRAWDASFVLAGCCLTSEEGTDASRFEAAEVGRSEDVVFGPAIAAGFGGSVEVFEGEWRVYGRAVRAAGPECAHVLGGCLGFRGRRDRAVRLSASRMEGWF
jgi:hypothetical protein